MKAFVISPVLEMIIFVPAITFAKSAFKDPGARDASVVIVFRYLSYELFNGMSGLTPSWLSRANVTQYGEVIEEGCGASDEGIAPEGVTTGICFTGIPVEGAEDGTPMGADEDTPVDPQAVTRITMLPATPRDRNTCAR